jgi:hypothetical protein
MSFTVSEELIMNRLQLLAWRARRIHHTIRQSSIQVSVWLNNRKWTAMGRFWLSARLTVPRIPKAGCKQQPNEAHGQKPRRRPVSIFKFMRIPESVL